MYLDFIFLSIKLYFPHGEFAETYPQGVFSPLRNSLSLRLYLWPELQNYNLHIQFLAEEVLEFALLLYDASHPVVGRLQGHLVSDVSQ